jgi:SPP1 family predicted phage head-tail adaptor
VGLTNDLKHRLTVLNKKQMENDRGEIYYDYAPDGAIWGALSVVSGSTETLPGGAERAVVTHRITIRPRSCKLTTATRFLYQGQRYDVQYWQPHYKRRDRLEVLVRLVVEDGARRISV